MGILSEKRTAFIEVKKLSQAYTKVLNREK